jgi:pimeloyl-ACP methyl ester carboxylesterase
VSPSDTAPSDLPRVAGVSHRFVEARGMRFHVAEGGDGPPLVLLHGWPQHWYMWRHQLPELMRHFRVYCVDLRGHGWSDAPPTGYEKESLAADVVAVAEALGLSRFRLAGHDWGGWTGFLVCLMRPDLVERFVALNIAHPFIRPTRDVKALAALWYQALLGTPHLGAWALRHPYGVIRRALLGAMRARPLGEEDLEIYAARLRQPARAAATSALYRAFIFRELWAVLAGRYRDRRLRTPTLVLFGRDDVAVSVSAVEGLDAFADDSRVEFIDGAGHFVAEEAPELVTQRLCEFFG